MIYVSRFSNPELKTGKYTVVAISKGIPKWELGYQLAGQIRELAPSGYLMHEQNREKFASGYIFQLDKLGEIGVQMLINKFKPNERDVVLCCFEDIRNPERFCHRTNLARWLQKRAGVEVQELYDPTANKWEKKATPKKEVAGKQPEPELDQIKLW